MPIISKIYRSELSRIRKLGASIRHDKRFLLKKSRERGYDLGGLFVYPKRIYINPSVKKYAKRLNILLHEEGHYLDDSFCNSSLMWTEYRAEQNVLNRALKLNNKELLKITIANIKYCSSMRFKKQYPNLLFYYYASKRLMRTKLWTTVLKRINK